MCLKFKELFDESSNLFYFHRELLKLFLCKELINFEALCNLYGNNLMSLKVFKQDTPHGKKSWEELKNRLIEHVSRLQTQFPLDTCFENKKKS